MPRRRHIPALTAAFGATLVAAAGPLPACPLCDGDTGRAVRAGIADDDAALNVAAVASPFLVVAGVVLVAHFVPPRCRRRPTDRTGGPS